ncbi:HAD family phosphatase [Candidatus Woesearchaeota archaeon]|nr:HAD family phosphatase [Candidatus Woesearchaeota archaeon]
MIEAVIFDMDGVIIDTESFSESVELPFLKSRALEWKEGYENQIRGSSPENVYNFLKTHGGVKAELREFLTQYWLLSEDVYNNQVSLTNGFHETVQNLRANNLKIALASSTPRKFVDIVVNRFSLSPYFEVIMSGDNILHPKPHPEIYLVTMQKMGITAPNAVAVEDSYNGFLSAKRACLKGIGLKTNYNKSHLYLSDTTISDLRELTLDKLLTL